VRLSFDVLSYAGALTITAVADPDAVPDLTELAAALRDELTTLAVAPARDREDPVPAEALPAPTAATPAD
jgi:WS/DGAT C-terminal domain